MGRWCFHVRSLTLRLAETGAKVTDERILTWEELVEMEPRLADLLKRCTEAGRGLRSFCYEIAWFGPSGNTGFKAEFKQLVGHFAENRHPRLTTQYAYELGYQTLLSALPECRKCYRHTNDYDPDFEEYDGEVPPPPPGSGEIISR
jgi:hypothetical protein